MKHKPIIAGMLMASLAFMTTFTASAQESIDEIVSTVKSRVAPDKRQAIFDVKVVDNQGSVPMVIGIVDRPEFKTALEQALGDKASIAGVAVIPGDR